MALGLPALQVLFGGMTLLTVIAAAYDFCSSVGIRMVDRDP